MESTKKHLTARVIELRNAIRRKYKAFKDGTEESELMLEKQYKPIITELRKEQKSVKLEPKEVKPEIKQEIPRLVTSSPNPSMLDEEDMEEEEDDQQETSQYVQEKYRAPVTQKYILEFLKDHSNKMDHIYGPRIIKDHLLVGDSKLEFDNEGNIYVKGISYGNTEGLYEVLFKKQPDEELYTKDDLDAYKHLLMASNAHLKNYQPDAIVYRPVQSLKYKAIISELFPRTIYGKGITWKNTKARDIIHWDNPNELVERLIHISMSTETGNRVHSNEIVSIMEELREAGYIKGRGNSRFTSLLQ